MRINHRPLLFIVGILAMLMLIAGFAGCESSQSHHSGAAAGPSPEWIEHFHREQLRYEYERQQYEQQMRQR